MADFKVITDATATLAGKLDFLSTRHEVLVQNLAHLETPGYLEKDVTFEGFLAAESGEEGVAYKPIMDETESTKAIKSNGNSVHLEEEMAKLANNSVEYMAAIEVIKKHIGLMQTAVVDR